MNERREYVVSGYPCEPILAIAALHHLHQLEHARQRKQALSVMRDAVVENHIAKGEGGELVARLILILAFYKALKLPKEPDVRREITGVPVKEFLEALLPKEFSINTFWDHGPHHGGRSGDKAKTVFRDAEVYFTHFARWAETPQARHLWAAVVRGQAIQCMPQQKDVDIIIPVVLHPKARFTEQDMSGILIQVRNRGKAATAFPDATRIELFEPETTPYISVVFQLGIGDPEGKRANIPVHTLLIIRLRRQFAYRTDHHMPWIFVLRQEKQPEGGSTASISEDVRARALGRSIRMRTGCFTICSPHRTLWNAILGTAKHASTLWQR
jgi:hypothetical protein